MFRLADLMEQKKELFATIDAWDNGESNRISRPMKLYVSTVDG